jgi:hypothetical protein
MKFNEKKSQTSFRRHQAFNHYISSSCFADRSELVCRTQINCQLVGDAYAVTTWETPWLEYVDQGLRSHAFTPSPSFENNYSLLYDAGCREC